MVQYISSANEYNELMEQSMECLVILDFTASWCHACTQLMPHLSEIEDRYANVCVRKVDVDVFDTLADMFQVTALPTIVFIKNKQIKKTVVGFNIQEVYATLQKHM